MIDTVVIDVPFQSKHVYSESLDKNDRVSGFVDLKECHALGCKLGAGEVDSFKKIVDPEDPENPSKWEYLAEVSRLSVPWDSIASSNSSIAFKVFEGGVATYPRIQIKGSVNKILQGHNVFGSDDHTLILAIIQALCLAMPDFVEMLDFSQAELKQIDCTYTSQAENVDTALQIIRACKNVSKNQTRVSKNSHATSNYWGMSGKGERTSRNKVLKQYLKKYEVEHQIKEITKKLKNNPQNTYLVKQLAALNSKVVKDYAEKAVRYEASIMGDKLKSRGIPTQLGDFLDYCDTFNKTSKNTIIESLWLDGFRDVFAAFGDVNMTIYKDSEIFEVLDNLFTTYTETGKARQSKAKRLHKFYCDFQQYGFEKVKEMTSESKFYRDLADLNLVVPRSQLQNMFGNESNVVPIIRLVKIDFSNQLPDGYKEPEDLFTQYNRDGLAFKLHRS
jgi:II/X family phage/plasmid replication protein